LLVEVAEDTTTLVVAVQAVIATQLGQKLQVVTLLPNQKLH
jgi:hypothetical protein